MSSTSAPPTELVAWKAWPARQRPAAAALSALVIAALAGAAWVSFGPEWAVVSALLMGLGLNRFFLPSRFSIDEQGITAGYPLRTLRLRWLDVRRFAHDERGGFLSTRSVASRMDAYSGMHLIFAGDSGPIVEVIRSRLKDCSAPGEWEANEPAAAAGGGA